MDAATERVLGARVAVQLRLHPGAVVIVVGRLADSRGLLRALSPFRPALASVSFVDDLPSAMREGVTLYDASALRDHGPGVAEGRTAILIEGEDVRVVERR